MTIPSSLRTVAERLSEMGGISLGRRSDPDQLRSLVQSLRVGSAWTNQGIIELMRVGPDGDGGYLVPCNLDGLKYCFSPGVDRESRFELALAERGLQVFMADASVDGPAAQHRLFHFQKRFLSSYTDEAHHLLSLTDWLAQAPSSAPGDSILQMDIEGAEYEVLHSLNASDLNRFRVIVMELHCLPLLCHAWCFRFMAPALRKLLRTHAVIHIHPNNYSTGVEAAGIFLPNFAEFTLVQRSWIKEFRPTEGSFPHILDRDNVVTNPPLLLPAEWIWRQDQA